VSIYEAIGIAYTILATALFSAQLVYVCVQGLNHVRRLIERGQAEETLRLRRADSIERELAKVS
jgi:hypothetical protein